MKDESLCLEKNIESYQMKVEDIIVEIKYTNNDKTIEECMLNILKQKNKAGR